MEKANLRLGENIHILMSDEWFVSRIYNISNSVIGRQKTFVKEIGKIEPWGWLSA